MLVSDSDRGSRPDERPVFQKHLGTFVEDIWALLTHLGTTVRARPRVHKQFVRRPLCAGRAGDFSEPPG